MKKLILDWSKPEKLLIPTKTKNKDNNLDFIRFVAASLVIFSHSFPLTQGSNKFEPFNILSHGQTTLGTIAVYIFFIISGYLITQSYLRSKNILLFGAARILRIIPALLVVTILIIFILGPLTSSLPLFKYFSNNETFYYLKVILLYNPPYHLPGVFTKNIYPEAVNGSIWSLQWEVMCYILVALLGFFKKLNMRTVLFLFISIFIFRYFRPNGELSTNIYLFLSFAVGMIFYLYREYIPRSRIFFYIAACITILSLFISSYFDYVFVFLAGYIIFYLAFTKKPKITRFTQYGDFSYGLYIYAFPIQQTITMVFKNKINPIYEFILAYPLILLFAIVSWHLIEKHCLKLKKNSNREKMSINNILIQTHRSFLIT